MNLYKFKNYVIEEVSYYEYKNLLKSLYSNNIDDIEFCFIRLLEQKVKNINQLNIFEKIECLLYIRSLILGNEIILTVNDRNYNFDINDFFNKLKKEKYFWVKNLKFSYPNDLLLKDSSFKIIENNLVEIYIDDLEKYINVENFSLEQKKEIIDNLQNLNIFDILNNFYTNLNKNIFDVLDIPIRIFNGEIYFFLKNIFYKDLFGMYNFERFLIMNLHLNTYDFKHQTYGDLKIYYNELVKDIEKNKTDDGNKTLIS